MNTPATDKDLDTATSLAQAVIREDQAHSRLDDLGVPRGRNAVVWTVAGRLDWLAEHCRTAAGPDASNDHRRLTWSATWNPSHPEIGTEIRR